MGSRGTDHTVPAHRGRLIHNVVFPVPPGGDSCRPGQKFEVIRLPEDDDGQFEVDLCFAVNNTAYIDQLNRHRIKTTDPGVPLFAHNFRAGAVPAR